MTLVGVSESSKVRPMDPDWWVEFVVAALAEVGFPDADVWHENGALYSETCGDCTCTRDDQASGSCGPTEEQVDRAFALLNDTVTRLTAEA